MGIKKKEQKNIPDVKFNFLYKKKIKTIRSKEIFKNKKIVLFSLISALNPICYKIQLPRYNHLYYEFKKNGIDELICLSVDDIFVMEYLYKINKGNIFMLPDINQEF